jgi:hypothetical protein
MGMCKPSGGIENVTGRLGDLDREGKPNTRYDLYNERGVHIQSRWYDTEGWVIHNRDYNHDPKPHDHEWKMDDIKGPLRSKKHLPVDPDFC